MKNRKTEDSIGNWQTEELLHSKVMDDNGDDSLWSKKKIFNTQNQEEESWIEGFTGSRAQWLHLSDK